jgi:hypothetical protein
VRTLDVARLKALLFLVAWVGFRLFSLIPNTINEIHSTLSFAVIIHCSANSIIFLTINKEVRTVRSRRGEGIKRRVQNQKIISKE